MFRNLRAEAMLGQPSLEEVNFRSVAIPAWIGHASVDR
jgi:hypothetical protein